jgi:hypothetical protein
MSPSDYDRLTLGERDAIAKEQRKKIQAQRRR